MLNKKLFLLCCMGGLSVQISVGNILLSAPCVGNKANISSALSNTNTEKFKSSKDVPCLTTLTKKYAITLTADVPCVNLPCLTANNNNIAKTIIEDVPCVNLPCLTTSNKNVVKTIVEDVPC